MGNCSQRAVADAAHEDALRTPPPPIIPSFNGFAATVANRRNGVWKVKLVVDPRDLERILSEGVNTEALIERMRFAANSGDQVLLGSNQFLTNVLIEPCPSRSHAHLRWL